MAAQRIPEAISESRSTRSGIGGWVANRLENWAFCPESDLKGSAMKSVDTEGSTFIGVRAVPWSSLGRALARARGFPVVSAPLRSA